MDNSNKADSHGGVALLISSSLEINGSTFANNRAEEKGGVYWIYHRGVMLH